MATCANCGTMILFGGKKLNGLRFCSDKCLAEGAPLTIDQVPDHLVDKFVQEVHAGACPKCGREGPIDVHASHKAFSCVVMTSWSTKTQICCRSCGVKSNIGNTIFTLLFGWWGFPFGLIATPIQIGRNMGGLFSLPNASYPSEKLREVLKVQLSSDISEAQRTHAIHEDY